MATNTTTATTRISRFDTSKLKRTLVISGVLTTLIGGEILAGQELFATAEQSIVPTVIPTARAPISEMAWALDQTPLTELIIPDPVKSNVPIVDGQLLVDGEPMVELVIPDTAQVDMATIDTSTLVGDTPIIELVIPNPVAIPASSIAIDIGDAPLVGVVVTDRNNGGGGTAASIPAPTTTSKSSK